MDGYKKSLLVNWILLIIYSSINSYTVYNLSHSWPTKGSLFWFLLIFFCPPLLYHFIAISYAVVTKRILHRKKVSRLVSLITGILLAGGLLQYSQKNSLQNFDKAYFPMIERLKQNMPMPCESEYFRIPRVVVYNKTVKRMIHQQGRPIARLGYNQDAFMLYFVAGSVDIKGSTIFYDSDVEQWQMFHNADLPMIDKFKHKLSQLKKCKTFK